MKISGARRHLLLAALGSGLCTYVFFCEYLPPISRLHLPYDIHGFHYPLLQYAFAAFEQGRFPEWDSGIYCGQTFVGNIQAALFYPPNWLLFAVNWGRDHLSYKSLQALMFAHLWLAFVLCYGWLRARELLPLACALGAGVLVFGGYMVAELDHVGVITGMAWAPLGFLGIEQAARGGNSRSLWKTIVASAMCFLAGYPPTWIVLCVCLLAYAASGPRPIPLLLKTGCAIASSVAVTMIQLLPAMEAASVKEFDPKFGGGIPAAQFFISFLIPNYHGFAMGAPPPAYDLAQYLYIGAPGLLGLAVAMLRFRASIPGWIVAAVSLLIFTNPFNLVESSLQHSSLLIQSTHAYNFLEGIEYALAILAATGLDHLLRRPSPRRVWLTRSCAIGLPVWAAWLTWVSRPGALEFRSGWAGAVEPAVTLFLFTSGLLAFRGESGRPKLLIAVLLLACTAADYRAFGVGKSFNADHRDVDTFFPAGEFYGVDDAAYREMLAHPDNRLAIGQIGPHPTELRHFGLSTPQGFDPLLSEQYKKFLVGEGALFESDRIFSIAPEQERLLQLLGVRYFILTKGSSEWNLLSNHPDFHALPRPVSFFQVLEYKRARPAYYWESETEQSSIQRTHWTAERREFVVESKAGGRFVLAEQYYPGWRAEVDGRETPVDRWMGVFQSVKLPPGRHKLRFEYRSLGLRMGAAISSISLAALALWFTLKNRRSPLFR